MENGNKIKFCLLLCLIIVLLVGCKQEEPAFFIEDELCKKIQKDVSFHELHITIQDLIVYEYEDQTFVYLKSNQAYGDYPRDDYEFVYFIRGGWRFLNLAWDDFDDMRSYYNEYLLAKEMGTAKTFSADQIKSFNEMINTPLPKEDQ